MAGGDGGEKNIIDHQKSEKSNVMSANISKEGDYIDDGFDNMEEPFEPEPTTIDELYEILKERNTKLLEEISELKKERDERNLQVERLHQDYRSLKSKLSNAEAEYDDKVSELKDALAKSESRLLKYLNNATKTKRGEAKQIAELTAENIKLVKHQRKCANLAKLSLDKFKDVKKKVLEAIDLKNCRSNLKEVKDKFQRVSAQKEKLKKQLRDSEGKLNKTDTALDKARHEAETLKRQCSEAVDTAKHLQKERDELLEILRERREAFTKSISIENEGPRSLLEEMALEANASSVGNAGRNLEPEITSKDGSINLFSKDKWPSPPMMTYDDDDY